MRPKLRLFPITVYRRWLPPADSHAEARPSQINTGSRPAIIARATEINAWSGTIIAWIVIVISVARPHDDWSATAIDAAVVRTIPVVRPTRTTMHAIN